MFKFFAAPPVNFNKIDGGSIGYTGVADPNASLVSLLNTVYLWAGIVAVLMIVIAGYFYVTSNGDANKVKQAKNIILSSVVGIVVILMAFAITGLVTKSF